MTDGEKLDLILSEIQGIKTEVQDMKTDIQELKQRTTVIENSITDIKLTVENEIRVNIQRVAEGHLDLSRKLNECIKISNDIKDKQELHDIYINMHNNKLRAL